MYGAPPEPLEALPNARRSELPAGWRDAERDEWVDPHAPSWRSGLVLRLAAVAVVVIAVVGVLVWVAAGHYSRGVEALRAEAYSRAMGEFEAAKILIFPYRDAQALEQQAQRALQAEFSARQAAEERTAAVVAGLERAAARLRAGDTTGVLAAIDAISPDDLRAAAANAPAAEVATKLTEDLTAAAQNALQGAAWARAGRLAAALLALDPGNEQASSLAARALTGQQLKTKLGEAEAAARSGEWRKALRLALAVVAVRKDFPGAAALVADARVALAPKPKPTPTQAPVVVAQPDTGGTTTTPVTPTQPPPP